MGRPMSDRVCDVEGCGRKHRARGLCYAHYKRVRRNGQTDLLPKTKPVDQRFWQNVDKNGAIPAVRPDLGPCWLWTGNINGGGCGRLNVGGRLWRAHRLVFEVMGGDAVPSDLTVDHLCMTHACVRPEHLEIVTAVENTRRATVHYAGKPRSTHCSKGHPKVGANLLARDDGTFLCRICQFLANYRAHIARGVNDCRCDERAAALAAAMDTGGHTYLGSSHIDRQHDDGSSE